jgi:hypothetical protein
MGKTMWKGMPTLAFVGFLVVGALPVVLSGVGFGVEPAMAKDQEGHKVHKGQNGRLQQRIAELEDIEAIKNLKYLYGEIADDDHNPDRVIKLFTEDGIWEGAEFGTAQGHEDIHALWQGFREFIDFSQHNFSNPRIEVDGDRATGTWTLWGPYRVRETGEEYLLAGTYQDDYVKINGVWYFQHLRFTPRLWAPLHEGWSDELLKF